MKWPDISVVIPCYNGEPYLGEAIDSVLEQTYAPREVLVVDDGSTDSSASIAGSYGPPVRVLSQENRGESAARNRGLDEAVSPWVAFLDADDRWEPEKLARQVAAIDDDVLGIHTDYYVFGAKQDVRRLGSIPQEQRYSLQFAATNNPLFISSLLVRRAAAPRFPTWTRYGEDAVYQLELVRRGGLRHVPEPLTGYRAHAASQSHRDPTVVIRWQESIERWLAETDVPDEEAQAIRAAWLDRVAEAAETAFWRREWRAYWILRRHLAQYPESPRAAAIAAQRVYPRWLYRLKDSLDRLRRSASVEPAAKSL